MKPTLTLMLGLLMLCGQGCRSNAAFPPVFVNEREWKGPGFYCVAWDYREEPLLMGVWCGVDIYIKNYTSQFFFVHNPEAFPLDAIKLTYKQGNITREAIRRVSMTSDPSEYYKLLRPYTRREKNIRTINSGDMRSWMRYEGPGETHHGEEHYPIEVFAELTMPYYLSGDAKIHLLILRLTQTIESKDKRSPWRMTGYEYQ